MNILELIQSAIKAATRAPTGKLTFGSDSEHKCDTSEYEDCDPLRVYRIPVCISDSELDCLADICVV